MFAGARVLKERASRWTCILLLAAFAGGTVSAAPSPWVYLPEEGVISNDNAVAESYDWVLNVSVLDASRRTLAIGRGRPGDAYVVGDGTVRGGVMLNLSRPIADRQGNRWTIERFRNRCFELDGSPIVTFIAPRELTAIEGKQFDYTSKPSQLSLIFDCPYLTALSPGLLGNGYDNIRLKVPRCREISAYSMTMFGLVDAGSWDLSGVESVGQLAFAWGRLSGNLRLPSLRTMDATVMTSALLSRMELGTRFNTLRLVSETGCNSCREIVLGGAKGFVIHSGGLKCENLERVWMTGSIPTYYGDGLVFGTEQHGEKSIVFYIPETREWRSIVEQATKLTPEEEAAFKKAHPQWKVPFGTVAPNVFRTQCRQYIGFEGAASCGLSISCRSGERYGSLSVTANGQPVTGEELPRGTRIEVKATPLNESARVSWEGRLPDGTIPSGDSFSFDLTAPVTLSVRFSPRWEYDPVQRTLSDGYWTFVAMDVSARYGGTRLLKIGRTKKERRDRRRMPPWAFPSIGPFSTLSGEIDLSGRICTKGNAAEEWSIVEISDAAFSKSSAQIQSFYAPRTLRRLGGQIFNSVDSLENVVFDCPDLQGDFSASSWDFGFSKISRLVLSLPQVTRIGGHNLAGAPLDMTDLSDFSLSNVRQLDEEALRAGAWNGPGPDGELDLPNVERIGRSAFYNWTRITSAALGTNGTLKSVDATIFWNNKRYLRKLDFGLSSDFRVDNLAFYATTYDPKVNSIDEPLPVEEIWFAGDAPSRETLNNILVLRKVADDGSKPVKIFAHLSRPSWKAICLPLMPEEAVAAKQIEQESGVVIRGVYANGANERVAWLVDRADR